MKKELIPGLTFEVNEVVTADKTAASVGSGLLPVYATPAMIALMEQCAYRAILDCLEEGQGSVGTLMNVKHLSATAEGRTVRAKATVTEVDGRRIVFRVEAYDEVGLIGEGIHERFLIMNEKFLKKAREKA